VGESRDESFGQTCHQTLARSTIHVGAWPGEDAYGVRTVAKREQREERTDSQATRTREAFETQKIRHGSIVLQQNFVEADGQTGSMVDVAFCLLLLGQFQG